MDELYEDRDMGLDPTLDDLGKARDWIERYRKSQMMRGGASGAPRHLLVALAAIDEAIDVRIDREMKADG